MDFRTDLPEHFRGNGEGGVAQFAARIGLVHADDHPHNHATILVPNWRAAVTLIQFYRAQLKQLLTILCHNAKYLTACMNTFDRAHTRISKRLKWVT